MGNGKSAPGKDDLPLIFFKKKKEINVHASMPDDEESNSLHYMHTKIGFHLGDLVASNAPATPLLHVPHHLAWERLNRVHIYINSNPHAHKFVHIK